MDCRDAALSAFMEEIEIKYRSPPYKLVVFSSILEVFENE